MKDKERASPQHEELRRLLRERRFRSGLTQRQLAERLGWDQKTISDIEIGEKRVTVVELLDLAKALGFDAAAAIRRLERRGPQ